MALQPQQNSEPTAEPEDTSAQDEVEAIISFDPFGSEPGEQPQQEPAAEPDPAQAAPASQEPSEPAQQQPAQQPTGPTEVDTLRQQLQEAQTTIQAYQTRQQQQPAREPTQPSEPEIPGYDFTFPPQLIESLRSENPAEHQAGLAALTKGVAQAVHKTLRAEISQAVTGLRESLPGMLDERFQTQHTTQTIGQDFYGEHQDLARPELRPLVVSVAQGVMQKWHGQGKPIAWSPEFKKEIADGVRAVLGQAPASAPAAPTPAASMPSMGNGTRPAAPRAGNEEIEVQRTLGFLE